MSYRQTHFIERNDLVKMQTFEGWGTSLCWWASVIGKWKEESVVKEICRLLFCAESGLGLNLVRYNLGAGEFPPNIESFRKGAALPCFLSADGSWSWGADAAQKTVLKQAVDFGVDHVELFLNSPPQWMTRSGSTAGSHHGLCNLKPDMFTRFAEYLAECVLHFEQEFAGVISGISPCNEPVSFWWKSGNDQEGCHFDVAQQSELIENLYESLTRRGVNHVAVSAPECWSTYETIYCCNHYPASTLRAIGQINTHSYFSDSQSRKELAQIAKRLGKPLCMSEVTCGGTAPHHHDDITGALELAQNIIVHLCEMQAQSWVYWQAVENEQLGHNHGLLHADFDSSGKYFLTKQYSAMLCFSRFIRPAYTILGGTPAGTIMAQSADEKILVLIAVNPTEQWRRLVMTNREPVVPSQVRVFRTSPTENFSQIISDECQELALAPLSITGYEFRFI